MRARSTLAALAAALGTLVLASPAGAQIPYAPCQQPLGFQCGQLAVPLDRTGAVPGTVTLNVQRVVAASNPTATAVVALAGGPGQPALPAATDFAAILGPALASRDLVVFDQRGTGTSNRLSCPAFQDPTASIGDVARSCAEQLGPARAFFRTADSVDDIEAIRVESGYQKLVLFGVSYGTKVAEDYAAKYPANVESLVLDSIVPPEGSDVLNLSTFKAMGRALAELCSNGACNGITSNPLRDVATLAAKATKSPIVGPVSTPAGRNLRVRVDARGLYGILLAGDLNPTLRAELPGAIRSAIRKDVRPLLRLYVRAAGLTGIPGARAQSGVDATESDALFLATRCEESAFPWDRAADPTTRAGQAVAAAKAHPAGDFFPFDYRVALNSEAIPVCLAWPDASPPPDPPAPLPAVPTLIISGDADLRTPLEDGQLVASRIAGAQVLGVPYTGHSVLGTDLSGCAQAAVATFFAGQPVAPCANVRQIFTPTPVAPTRLSRVRGRTTALKTVAAVAATITDVRRQFLGDAIAAGRLTPVGARVVGLRSGRATAVPGAFSLRDVEYVPGVTVSGRVHRTGVSGTLTVRGPAAPGGRLTFRADGTVTGTLGGRKVRARSAAAAQAMSPTTGWPAALPPHPGLVGLG
jgi:pimeloyl-ACP methyl ester carboxylesterase